MMTWTCKFPGVWSDGYAVVSAEDVSTAIVWLEKELGRIGLHLKIKPEDLIPMVTSSRKVRILSDGDV